MSIHRSFSRIRHENTNSGDYLLGEVVTPYGVVIAYSQGYDKNSSFSRLDYAFKGQLFIRNFTNKRFSRQYLVTLSNRFAKEISNRK